MNGVHMQSPPPLRCCRDPCAGRSLAASRRSRRGFRSGQSLLCAEHPAVPSSAVRPDQGCGLPAGDRSRHGGATGRNASALRTTPRRPRLHNTFVAMEKSGLLLSRALAAFRGVSEADTNPTLQSAKAALAPKIAAHEDAIHLDKKLFERVAAIYKRRATLRLDAESLRLVEFTYDEFVHVGRKSLGPGQGAAQGAERRGVDPVGRLFHQIIGGDQGRRLLDARPRGSGGLQRSAALRRGSGGAAAQDSRFRGPVCRTPPSSRRWRR